MGKGRIKKEFVAIYLSRKEAFKELKLRDWEEDLEFRDTGVTKMFKIERTKINHEGVLR